jgi:hypothetical protein
MLKLIPQEFNLGRKWNDGLLVSWHLLFFLFSHHGMTNEVPRLIVGHCCLQPKLLWLLSLKLWILPGGLPHMTLIQSLCQTH